MRQQEQVAQEEWAKLPVNRCRTFIDSYRKHFDCSGANASLLYYLKYYVE